MRAPLGPYRQAASLGPLNFRPRSIDRFHARQAIGPGPWLLSLISVSALAISMVHAATDASADFDTRIALADSEEAAPPKADNDPKTAPSASAPTDAPASPASSPDQTSEAKDAAASDAPAADPAAPGDARSSDVPASGESPPGDAEGDVADPPPAPDAVPLEGVRDLARLQPDERLAYFKLLDEVRKADPDHERIQASKVLAESKRRFTADPGNRNRKYSLFVDVIKHPSEFRGRPLTLRGYIRRLNAFDAGENEFGFTKLHEAWLFTDDPHSSPYVVICSEIPPNIPIPTPRSPTDKVRVTARFFKVWTFESAQGPWGAPLLLGHRLEWLPEPSTKMSPELQRALGAGLALLLALACLSMWYFQRRTRLQHQALLKSLHPEAVDPVPGLRDLERRS